MMPYWSSHQSLDADPQVWVMPGGDRRNGATRPVVFCHGFIVGAPFATQALVYRQICQVVDSGRYAIASSDMGQNNWGNAASQTALDALLLRLRSASGGGANPSGKFALIGLSMGNVTALQYARTHLANIAGVIGIAAVADLSYQRGTSGSPGAFFGSINAAYGLTGDAAGDASYNANVKPVRDPQVYALNGVLAGLAYREFHFSDDPTAPVGQAATLCASIGASATQQVLGTGGHAFSPSGQQLLAALDSLNW